MKKILLLGIIAAILFSTTFFINHYIYTVDDTAHWYWTASLRYFYVFIILSVILLVRDGQQVFKETLQCYKKYWRFWTLAGGIGYGLFYLPLCNASRLDGWLESVAWQFTILATPVILLFFGKRVSKWVIACLVVIQIGVLMVLSEKYHVEKSTVISTLTVFFAAFCYPLGNTLCKYACEGKFDKYSIDKKIADNVLSQILLMTLGAAPVFILAGFLFDAPLFPTSTQVGLVALVAIFSGVIATGIFYKARQLAKDNPSKLAIADGTQAMEVPAALFFGTTFSSEYTPDFWGVAGVAVVIIGVWAFSYFNQNPTPENEGANPKLNLDEI